MNKSRSTQMRRQALQRRQDSRIFIVRMQAYGADDFTTVAASRGQTIADWFKERLIVWFTNFVGGDARLDILSVEEEKVQVDAFKSNAPA